MAQKRKIKPPKPGSIDGIQAPVDHALALIQALPPTAATLNYGERAARQSFEEALKPLLDQLDTLCERHLPEALVPSPCGQSRLGPALCRPWGNLLYCHDACGRCREQAKRALRLLREAVVDGRPSERFIAPEIAAALIERATRAAEQDRASRERSMATFRERFREQMSRGQKPGPTSQVGPPAPGRGSLSDRSEAPDPGPRGKRRSAHRSPAPPGWIYSTDAQKKYDLSPSTLNGYRNRIAKKNKADVCKDPDSKQVFVREDALRTILGLRPNA